MNISELESCSINPAVAYILGLVYPLYKEKDILTKSFLVGAINHQPGMINDEDLAVHFKSVKDLFDKELGDSKVQITANQTDKYSVSSKAGFSILIEKTNVSKNECLEILDKKIQELKLSDIVNRIHFVRGCFDGRSSFDTTTHYISIDVDRDEIRQNQIEEIINSVGLDVNINRRGEGHPKNDQIRIQKNCGEKFMKTIGFYSKRRTDIVNKYI